MKKAILGALFAGAMLVSCSSDEPLVNGGEDNNKGDGYYLAVNVVTSGDTGSRAVTDGGYEKGDNAENAATKGLFLIFNSDGTQYGTPQELNLTWNEIGDYAPNVERIANAVLVIGSETEGVNEIKATDILVVLNPTENMAAALTNKTLTEVKSTVGNYDYGKNNKGEELNSQNFVMTNSVYVESENKRPTTGEEVCAASIAGHVMTSPEAAKLNPVDIYVERVLCKVKANAYNNIAVTNTAISLGGDEITLKPVITGIEVANRANKARLFKSIDGWTSWNYTWDWNDAANKRSYWATVPNDEIGYDNSSYDQIVSGSAKGQNASVYYCQPNTSATQPTAILVTAELRDASKTDATEGVTFVKFAGAYYTPEGALAILANTLHNAGWRYETTVDGNKVQKDIDTKNLAWNMTKHSETEIAKGAADLESWEAVAMLKAEGTDALSENTVFVNITDTEEGKTYDASAVNLRMTQKQYRAWFWNGGKCYYYVNIEHFGTPKDANNKDDANTALIRNHVYDLTLSSLKGLGVPVFDPGEEIIPETPSDDQFYLAARINILKWKIVKQTVQFGE